jgi:hypothetical protein
MVKTFVGWENLFMRLKKKCQAQVENGAMIKCKP